MNIDELTLGQAKELLTMFQSTATAQTGLNGMIGNKVIIRTYSAGVWFGELAEKAGNEVIILNARRMWRWWAKESISLSAVALYGIKLDKSKIAPAVPQVWLEAIEIIPCAHQAISTIENAPNVTAE